jgi:rhodanese-related sulfurtransferase
MNKRALKDLLFEQVARIGKAVASPKRLELLELLAQGEKTVEQLATEAEIDIRLASAHLKALREAHLVQNQKQGRNVSYRLTGRDVSDLWVNLHHVAQEHLVELKLALDEIFSAPEQLDETTRPNLLERAKRGDIIVLDVRPSEEFAAGHLPYARSIPLNELRKRLAELPKEKEIAAYCRGPFCLFSTEAVELLRAQGYQAHKINDGIAEWQAAALPLEHTTRDE